MVEYSSKRYYACTQVPATLQALGLTFLGHLWHCAVAVNLLRIQFKSISIELCNCGMKQIIMLKEFDISCILIFHSRVE
jgi:hypothetical protein